MTAIDVDELLKEISPDQPCGPDLEYDPAFGELERSAQGRPEQVMGDMVQAAEEPDWREVARGASELLQRTRDLRVAVLLTRAVTRLRGHEGLRDGLELIHGLLTWQWDHVHPMLDADDDNDPTFRMNSMMPLSDRTASLNAVEDAVLVESRMAGRFGLRSIHLAAGRVEPREDEERPSPELIDGAFQDVDIDALRATHETVTRSSTLVGEIESLLSEKVGVQQTVDLAPLSAVLKEAVRELASRLAARGEAVAAAAEEVAGDGVGGAVGVPAAAAAPGSIQTRADVVKVLTAVVKWYATNEPSSPVPMILERAMRLVDMPFFEIVKDLAPDGVSQVEVLRGRSDEEGS